MFKPPHFFEKKRATYKNDNGAAAVGVLLGLTFYIFMISFILSFLIINIYGVNVIRNVTLPSSGNSFSSEQNYQNGTYDLAVNKNELYSKWEYVKGVGLSLKEMFFTAYTTAPDKGYTALRYIQPDANGDYINTYYINNSVHSNYCIGMRMNLRPFTQVCIDNTGLYIPDYLWVLGVPTNINWGNHVFYSYPNANLLEDIVIKTVYNDEKLTADIYFNNILVISTANLDSRWIQLSETYYAGLSGDTVDFTLKDFIAGNSVVMPNDTNILSSLANLLATMFAISVWSIPSWILPIEFVVIFITLPEAGIVLTALIVLIRGVD